MKTEYMARCETRPCGWFSAWHKSYMPVWRAASIHADERGHQVTINEA